MAVGIGATPANGFLNTMRAVAYTAPTSVYAKMHTADPGAAGLTAVSQNTAGAGKSTTITWSAASGGSMAWSAGGVFSAIAGLTAPTTETITHISLWNTTGDVFLWSVALSASKTISNGDSLSLTALTLSFTPLAA